MYTSAGVHSRTILDISEKLLSRTPAWVSRVQADLLDILPLQDESYDLILCSFVLLHLSALENLFIEARRVIRPKGRMLIFHHQERRPRVHTIEGRPCKIQTRHWTFEQIQE
ncbi:MAG: class I SAM-dependent methyltransferase [bacterium]|nr:class I SAM-dependent methyltransferase [bacterium]